MVGMSESFERSAGHFFFDFSGKMSDRVKLKAQIMDEAAVDRALKRISHEIAEKNKGVENVVAAGHENRPGAFLRGA